MKLSTFTFLTLATVASAATPLTDIKLSGTSNQVLSGATLTAKSGSTIAWENGAIFGGDAGAFRTATGLAIGTNVQAYDADLTTYADITPSANVQTLLGAADFAAARSSLGLIIGTNVQAYDADLTTFAAITPSANVQSLLGATNYAAIKSLLAVAQADVTGLTTSSAPTFAGLTVSGGTLASGTSMTLNTASNATLNLSPGTGLINLTSNALVTSTNKLSFGSDGTEYINSPAAGEIAFANRGSFNFYADTNDNDGTFDEFVWHTGEAAGATAKKRMILANRGSLRLGVASDDGTNLLQVGGPALITGLLKTGSAPTTLTNAAGQLLGLPGPVFNVKTDYGAALDGTTDDTTAIQAAINAAVSAGGGTVYFSGIGKITSALTISSSVGIRLLGGDRNTCGVKASAQSLGALLAITGNNVTVENLKLDGVYTTGTHSGDFGLINITDATGVRVLRCLIVNSLDRGVRIRGATLDTEIAGTRFSNYFCGIHSYSTSSAATPQRINIHNCEFLDGWSDAGETGGIKLQTNQDYTTWSRGHRVENNSFVNSGQMGVELWGYIGDSIVAGNTIEDVTFGISLDHTENTTVTANTVRRFSYIGLEAASLCRDDIFSSNIVIGYDAAGARDGTYGIVTSNTPPTHLTIVGNRIRGVDGSGIMLQTTDDVSVVSNSITDCNSCLNLKGSSRISARTNEFIGPVTYHVFIDCADSDEEDITIAGNTFRGAAAQDNIMIYDGENTHTLTRLTILNNDLGSATAALFAVNYNIPTSRLPYSLIEGNYWTSAGSQLPDSGRYDQLSKPFIPSDQEMSIPIARKFHFVLPSAETDSWVKIFTRNWGNPMVLAFHVNAFFQATDNKANSITAIVAGSPYSQDCNIMKYPDSYYQSGVLKGIRYNNPTSGEGSTQEIWLHFKPTGGGDVYVGGGDFGDYWITSPTAVTTEPTWGTNTYEIDTSTGNPALKTRYLDLGIISGSELASSPGAPATNGFKIYAVDNGSGKTQLRVRFATGAEQTLTTEP